MSTAQSTVEYILDQLTAIPNVSARKMFGEYALYAGNKVVALVCDNTMFVKITEAGKGLLVQSMLRAMHTRVQKYRWRFLKI